MIQVPEALIVALLLLGVSNLGVLVFFLGRITEKLKAYDAWASQCERCSKVVAVLANKEGMTL